MNAHTIAQDLIGVAEAINFEVAHTYAKEAKHNLVVEARDWRHWARMKLSGICYSKKHVENHTRYPGMCEGELEKHLHYQTRSKTLRGAGPNVTVYLGYNVNFLEFFREDKDGDLFDYATFLDESHWKLNNYRWRLVEELNERIEYLMLKKERTLYPEEPHFTKGG